MTYVLDTNSFRVLGNYYPDRFPSFWSVFNEFVDDGRIISVREVKNELNFQANEHIAAWMKAHSAVFTVPSAEELRFVTEIFKVPHFQQLVGARQRLSGQPAADPFVIAAAKVRNSSVVTEEAHRPNAAKIPNVCQHFGIRCMSIQELMAAEGWQF